MHVFSSSHQLHFQGRSQDLGGSQEIFLHSALYDIFKVLVLIFYNLILPKIYWNAREILKRKNITTS